MSVACSSFVPLISRCIPLTSSLMTAFVLLMAPTAAMAQDDFPKAFNTDPPDSHPPTPEEMVKLIELPPGFNVTLFAGEPDVQQPICMDFDDKGRLWVAECYTYSGGPYETKLRDRVVILEDQDGDGKHDSRKVFWDKGFMLTSLTWGFGGLWILHDGTLSFIPDKDGDDVPDSEPIVMLDGWSKDCGHNFVSGLIWGPDGWLYGRHGIVDTSYPGIPGTPKEERPFMNCGVWRFDPTKHLIEVVCNGTTNPWGLDYNEDGQFFMTNNVQGHLWHVIPGARYQRMYGQDFNPHSYELMDMTADHYHWDTKTKWNESRDGVANDLGGGHSHVGALIYQGDNFPKEYFGKIFMCNTHGRRINVNRLDREGSGYVGRSEPDFMIVKNPWFRGIDIKMGPEGAMYVSDWSDNGECHDHDGVHRTSGRIYRIAYGTPERLPSGFNLALEVNGRLREHALADDSWKRRKALRLIRERVLSYDPKLIEAEHVAREQEKGRNDPARRTSADMKDRKGDDLVRSGWKPGSTSTLSNLSMQGRVSLKRIHSTDVRHAMRQFRLLEAHTELDMAFCQKMLLAPTETIQANTVGLIAASIRNGREVSSLETQRPKYIESIRPLQELLSTTESGLVRLALASNMDVISGRDKFAFANLILSKENGGNSDRNLELMVWYQIEPVVCLFPEDALKFASESAGLTYPRFIARRICEGNLSDCAAFSDFVQHLPSMSSEIQEQVLTGMSQGLAAKTSAKPPLTWTVASRTLEQSKNASIAQLTKTLSALFGNGRTIEELRKLVVDRAGDAAARSNAIDALARIGDLQTPPALFTVLDDRAVYHSAIAALASFDHPDTAKELLNRMGGFKDGNRSLAIDTMASREPYALELIKAIEEGSIDARELTASQVRQLTAFGNEHVKTVLEAKWGVIQETPAARIASIEKWKHELTPETIAKADRENGAALFKKSCAACHKLYGEGKAIAPDLTGANRSNLEYLLMNIIDPSSVVPKQFTTSVVALKDGRIITGVIVSETDQTLVIQTDKEQLSVARNDVEESRNTGKSLMADGMLDTLTPEQVRDLFGFIMPRK